MPIYGTYRSPHRFTPLFDILNICTREPPSGARFPPYAANGLNQYTGTVSTLSGSTTFGYDANGNLASDGTHSFTYDAENRLVADNAGDTLIYDPLGRLYQVTNASSTETYLYAGDQRVAEYDATGAMTARYVPGAGEDNPLIWMDLYAYVGNDPVDGRDPSGQQSEFYDLEATMDSWQKAGMSEEEIRRRISAGAVADISWMGTDGLAFLALRGIGAVANTSFQVLRIHQI